MPGRPATLSTTSTATATADERRIRADGVMAAPSGTIIATNHVQTSVRSGSDQFALIVQCLEQNRPVVIYAYALGFINQLHNYFKMHPEKRSLVIECRALKRDSRDEEMLNCETWCHTKYIGAFEGSPEFDELREGLSVSETVEALRRLTPAVRQRVLGRMLVAIGGSCNGYTVSRAPSDHNQQAKDVLIVWTPMVHGNGLTEGELDDFQSPAVEIYLAHLGNGTVDEAGLHDAQSIVVPASGGRSKSAAEKPRKLKAKKGDGDGGGGGGRR